MELGKPHAHGAATQGATAGNLASASRSTAAQSSIIAITARSGGALTPQQEGVIESRGLNVELVTRLGWRAGKPNAIGEIEIPYWRNGKEVNCKTRTILGEKRFHQVQGGEKCFYNVDALKEIPEGQPIVVTEGEMDCIIALQCGFLSVSVPDGAPKEAIGDRQTVKYDYLADMPSTASKIILAVDSDNAGANLFHDLSIRLGVHRCMFVKYPEGCKDLNDVFRHGGMEAVVRVISAAKFMKIEGLYQMDELPPVPVFPAHDVGVPKLSGSLRLRRGDFSVVTGIPSHGKSTFVNQLVFNMARDHDWITCFASFEQPPQTEHRKALRTLFSGRPEQHINPETMARADKFIKDKFVFIVPGDLMNEAADLTWMLDRMVAAVTRYNAKMIVIDPWNEIEHMFDTRAMTMTQYIGWAIRELKQFARKYQVHVMVIAHPAKMRKEKDTGNYPIPTAYDISDSAHWYNKPDQVIIVHRQGDKDNTLIRIAKSRYHYALGKPGDVELEYSDYDNTFS